VIGLVFALLAVCGLCFAAGYAVGHHRSASSASNASTPAPDQDPLQPNGSVPKPSATEQPAVPTPQTGDSPTNPDPGTPAADGNPATTGQSPGDGGEGGSSTGSPATKTPHSSPPAEPATGNAAPETQGGPTPNAREA
jgi:hypothetical protein